MWCNYKRRRILKVQLTAANIQSMNSNPMPALPAPGIGKIYEVEKMIARINFGTTGFTGQTSIGLTYDPSNALASFCDVPILTNTVTTMNYGVAPLDGGQNTIIENTALQLIVDSDGVTGDSTVDVWIIYYELEL
jgi:hypothetical protein